MSMPCNSEHLWVCDGDAAIDDLETFACSRCGAKSVECSACDGVGFDEEAEDEADEDDETDFTCEMCGGTGVVEVKG